MISYTGALEEMEVIQFLRRELPKLRALRKVVITPQGVSVRDVNGDSIEFPGLTYGNELLETVLRELGVVFTAAKLHDVSATPGGVKEFRLSAVYTWGHDRVM